ncbi:MAG TPA: zinc ABC transporter substrate-binding protein [Phycisphaerae bacterium]|nr:zinc ABC transporter substrate-binding protein [Phycisphaerae bacterium]HOM51602.1 zinc ABC transporter substrate-binding protein [Phycisphaerae bacterium]HON65053.1 zinc ABC transporter substrate-binding protein [Phycisphaerae bacterium]HOQ85235.1 zinc ABC transporter substrate-binding protein [Phycisphaerae bacterium]HPU26472.1 zinc ABC transporter substrate-binding protein [Phycisphaerae bacterium]
MSAASAGCTEQTTARADGPPESYPYKVVTTVGMVTDIVANVTGDKAAIHRLIGSGVDPHLYKPTRSDVIALMEADIVFYSGLMLEGKLAGTLEKIGRTKPVVAVTEAIDRAYLLAPPDLEGHPDPHVWMDPSAWAKCVEAVVDALAKWDAANAEFYRANARAYIKQLEALHAYGKKAIATIPEQSRLLVTSHDAFNYFGRAFGLQVMGVQGLSTESEAGLQDLNRLVDVIATRNVKAVFVETSVPAKNIRALIEGARSRGQEVVIGGELFSDAMGEPGTYEGTYIGMIDHNITTVTRALGGEAPSRGLHGKLSRPAFE